MQPENPSNLGCSQPVALILSRFRQGAVKVIRQEPVQNPSHACLIFPASRAGAYMSQNPTQ